MQQFKIGDTVRLQSGGPVMTVTNVGNDLTDQMTVWCKWFLNQKVEDGSFPIEAVEVAEPPR